MVTRGLLAALLIGVLRVAAAGTPPVVEDVYLTTATETPVAFSLCAEDPDIDPADPTAHPLQFHLLEGPKHGMLIGDLGQVFYEPAHTAIADLIYVPAPGFIGVDRITVSATDPFGDPRQGLAVVQIHVDQARWAGLFSGTWGLSMSADAESSDSTVLRGKLVESYRDGEFSAEGIAFWRQDATSGGLAFDGLRLVAGFPVGGLATLDCTLALKPERPDLADLFDYWQVVSEFSLLGVDAQYVLYLDSQQTASYQMLIASGLFGDVLVKSTTRLALSTFALAFENEEVAVSWTWGDLSLSSSLEMTHEGFGQLTLGVEGVPILDLVGSGLGVGLSTELVFEKAAVRLAPSLEFRSDWLDCLQILVELASGTTRESRLSLYGVRLEYALPGEVRLLSATSLEQAKNAEITGYSDYFELVTLSGPTASHGDALSLWRLATYFKSSEPISFDWGMTRFSCDIGLPNGFRTSVEVVVRSGAFPLAPSMEVTLGFAICW